MPLYSYACSRCEEHIDEWRPVESRDAPGVHICSVKNERSGDLIRRLSLPFAAAIGGIPNRINRHWNEG